MKRGTRKAHRKTARRASFLPWSQHQSIQVGNQGSHGRKSQLQHLIDSDSSDDDMDFRSDSRQSDQMEDTDISEKRKSRASSVLRQLYRLEKERKSTTRMSKNDGDSRSRSSHKIVPLSSIVKDSKAAVDAGLNIFSEDHQEENILNAGQISQLEELFELVDSDNSKSVNLSDLIEFSISHNMCGKKEAFMIEEYVKEVSGYDESQISFPEFSSIAIAFDLIQFDDLEKSASNLLQEREDRLHAGSPPGLSQTMQMAMGVDGSKRPSLVERLVRSVTSVHDNTKVQITEESKNVETAHKKSKTAQEQCFYGGGIVHRSREFNGRSFDRNTRRG